ncbi:hypothetical protein IOD13_06780 [Brevibacterium casei]|nr:hypothetical protein [Brevibacterium casei]
MRKMIGQAGSAGALGGFYGSPPGLRPSTGTNSVRARPCSSPAPPRRFLRLPRGDETRHRGGGAQITLPPIDAGYSDPWSLGVAVVAAAAGLAFRGLHHGLERLVGRRVDRG